MDIDFDQTQAVVLEDIEEDDLTDELESIEEKKPTAFIKVLFQKGLTETTFPLYQGDNIIGRHADTCHVCIPSKSLSKEHACVQIVAGSHLISDKNSRNKTRRGKLVLRPDVWYELKHGDEIIFADVKCIYEISQQITQTVEETDSEADTTSESLLLHHDVTEEHSFDVTDKKEHEKCRPIVKGKATVLETQVITESEDEEENFMNKTEVVHETLLFDDSDSDADSDHDMRVAATQAYITESGDNSTNDCADDPSEEATQAYVETWTNLKEDRMRKKSAKIFVQPDTSLKDKKETVDSIHKSSQAGTQSFEVEVKSSLEGTQSFEETQNKNNTQNDSRDSNMRPTQVFEEDDDEDSEDAAGLFAESTVAFDGGDNNMNDGYVSDGSDTDGPTQDLDLEAPLLKTVSKDVTSGAVTNSCAVTTSLNEELVKNKAMGVCPPTETVILSTGTSTQKIDQLSPKTISKVPIPAVDEALTQTVDEAQTQTFPEVPMKKVDKNLSVNTSRNVQCHLDSNETMSTQVFDESVSTDIKKVNQRKTDQQKKQPRRSPQPVRYPSDESVVPIDSTLLVSEISDTHCSSRKERTRLTHKTISDQPKETLEDASSKQTQNYVPHREDSDLVKTDDEHQQTISCKKQDKHEDIKLSKNHCLAKDSSEEPTQAYGIEEDTDTQTYDTDSSLDAVSALEEPIQSYGSEDVDNTQIFIDNEKVDNGICDDNEGATQIFYEKESPQMFIGAAEHKLGKTSDAVTERYSDRSDDATKAHAHSDDDSDLEDESVLKTNLQPFYDPTQVIDDDNTAKNSNIEPTSDVTVKEKTDKLTDDKLLKAGKHRSGTGDDGNAHIFPDAEEMVPDSMADDTDERSPMIPLPASSPSKPALHGGKRSPSPTHKQREQTKKEVKNKPNEARRSTRGKSVLLLQETNEDDSSSQRPRRDRKRVISQAACSKNTKSLGVEMLAEDQSETKPAIEFNKEQHLSDIVKNEEDSLLDKNENELDKHDSRQTPSLDNQKSSSKSLLNASKRRRTAAIRTENSVTTTPDTGITPAASGTIVHKTRAKGEKGLISDNQEPVSSKLISEPVTRKTRRSVAFKIQDQDVRDSADKKTILIKRISDHQDIISLDQINKALTESVIKVEGDGIESDETASMASSVNDSDVKVDMEKKEEKINKSTRGRKKKVEIIRKEDSSESIIDDSSGNRVSSRGRRISTNPYLKDFETHSNKDKQRRSSLLPQGDETSTENKMTKRDNASDMKDVGKGKRKKTSDSTKTANEKVCDSVGPPQQVESSSKQIIQMDTGRDDIKQPESKKVSQFKSPGQDILNNEIQQEGKKIARSTKTGRKSTLSKKTENLLLSDSLQAGNSDTCQPSESSNKRRKSVNSSVSSDSATNRKNPIAERLQSDECKSSRQIRNTALQASSTRSRERKTQNVVVPPEFQTPNKPSAEDLHLASTGKSKTRVRKSMAAASVNSEVTESGKSSARLSKDKGNTVVAVSPVGRESRKQKQSEPHTQVSESPAKKFKLTSSPQTPVGKSEISKVNSHSPSLRKSSMYHKPRVMFTGLIDEQGEKIVKDLGGEMASSIQECTHLVTDKIRRTVKFLSGLAKGLLIVSPRWLDSCKQAGTFIDGRMFLVSDPAMEKQYKFSLATSINKAQGNPLLTGYKVHVSKSVRPEPAQMQDVLTCAGAEYLRSMPNKQQDNTVVISCQEDHKICQPAIKLGIPVVEAEFILTGILRQELDFESFVLFTEKHSAQQSRKSKTSR